MENKKGFTLIEMLGILVVLSVIVLVSLPSIIQTNRNAKQSELANAEQTIFMAAETYIELNEEASRSLDTSNYYYVSLETLIAEGLLVNNLKNPHPDAQEQAISEGNYWVEVRIERGNTIYTLVKNNPYEDDLIESDYAYNLLLSSGQISRDKILNGGKSNRLVYSGNNPNNYLRFSNEIWRIVALEEDGTIKIVKEDFLSTNYKFDAEKNEVQESDLIEYLNNGYYNNNLTPSARDMIATKEYNIGTYDFQTSTLENSEISSIENSEKLTKKIGVLNPSDYVNASTDEGCTVKASYNNSGIEPCSAQNYLYKSGARWWLMHAAGSGENVVISDGEDKITDDECQLTEMQKNKIGLNTYPSKCYAKVRPAMYLKKEITISSGNGSLSNPYIFTGA